MDVSTTAGPSGPLSSFSHDDWVDIKQLFVKACERYDCAFSGLERLCIAVILTPLPYSQRTSRDHSSLPRHHP